MSTRHSRLYSTALLSDKTRYDNAVTFWEDVYGFDFSSLIPQTKKDWASDPPVTTVDPSCMASAPQQVLSIDCASVTLDELLDPMAGDLHLVADEDCTVHGFVLWFDVDFYGRASLSTSPTAAKTHWYQTILMLDTPHELRAGQALEGTIEVEPGSHPGEKRHLNVMVSYDVMPEGEEGGGDGGRETYPEDRQYFREFVVQ